MESKSEATEAEPATCAVKEEIEEMPMKEEIPLLEEPPSKEEDSIVDDRPLCGYGKDCYRMGNPQHCLMFRHPD